MFPFLPHRQKRLGITAWYRLGHTRDRLPEFVTCVCDDRLKRAFVVHGNDPALDPATKQIAHKILTLQIVELPALGLRVNVRKQFRQRLEFNEAVNRKGERAAILQNRRRRSDECVKRNLFRSQRRSQDHRDGNDCNDQTTCTFAHEFFHAPVVFAAQ